MNSIYQLFPIMDIPEYEGFAWGDRSASVRAQPSAAMDFDPGKVPPGGQAQAPHLRPHWRRARVIGNVSPWNDFPSIGLDTPAFSGRAVDALRDLLEPNGELLPLASDVGDYYAYNVTTVANVLDLERSQITWGLDYAYASRIKRYEFVPDLLAGLAIFRLPQKMLEYCVTEIFAQRVRDHRLQGFDLAKLWPLPPEADWWQRRMDRLKKWARRAERARQRGSSAPATEPPLEPWKDI